MCTHSFRLLKAVRYGKGKQFDERNILTVKRCLNFRINYVYDGISRDAADKIHSFLSMTAWRISYVDGCKSYHKGVIYSQVKMKYQVSFNNYRFDFLRKYFDNEIIEFNVELRQSQEEEDLELLNNWHNFDQKFLEELIFLFLERCKFRNSLNFM